MSQSTEDRSGTTRAERELTDVNLPSSNLISVQLTFASLVLIHDLVANQTVQIGHPNAVEAVQIASDTLTRIKEVLPKETD